MNFDFQVICFLDFSKAGCHVRWAILLVGLGTRYFSSLERNNIGAFLAERNFIPNHVAGMFWYLPERYTEVRPVSHGSFGYVWWVTFRVSFLVLLQNKTIICNFSSARDKISNRQVAIKLLKRPFDVMELAKRTYRELVVLSHMKHENVSA